MRPLRKLVALGLCLLAMSLRLEAALPPVPGIKSHFTDELQKVSKVANERIDKALGSIQEQFKVDAAVVILPTPVESLADMARSCYLTWGIGKSWEGGLLVVVDSKGTDCAVMQGAEDAPLSPQARSMVEGTTRAELKRAGYEKAVSLTVGRLQRLMEAKYKRMKVFPPLENDPGKGSAYGLGAGVVFLLALLSWKFRPWH